MATKRSAKRPPAPPKTSTGPTQGSRTAGDREARKLGAKQARERQLRTRSRRRAARRVGIPALAAVAIGAAVLLMLHTASGGVSYAGEFRTGGRIEKLTLPKLDGGGTIDYGALKGKPLVINFFASWCPYCVGEMPAFEKVHEQLGDSVEFLGISQSDGQAASVALAHRTGIRYPAGFDEAGTFFRAVGTGSMPTTIFVKPTGEIAYVQIGPLTEESLRQAVQAYLGVTV